MRKHRNIKLVATERKRNYLVTELNYYNRRFFTKNLVAIEIRKTQILIMNKPTHVGLSIFRSE